MANPVWVLSVDLQTKSATFVSGMGEAAKGARSAFTDIKAGAGEMGEAVGGKMTEARHGVMLLGEEFGVHMPRAITTFIASIGPVGAAMEAAFPFLAIIVGATLLLEHLAKLREEAEKLTEEQIRFQTSAQNAFNTLDQKLLQAGIRVDELRGNHLAALAKQLKLIDDQSLEDLVHQFDILGKAADAVFAELKTHWYSVGEGAAGAKHALDTFKDHYDLLLAQGKNKEASDLLAGTKESAEHTLSLMEQMSANRPNVWQGFAGDPAKMAAARQELEKTGVISRASHDITKSEVEAQQTLVDSLKAQVTVEEKVAALKQAQSTGAKLQTNKTMGAEADKVAREQAAAFKIGQELEQKDWEEHYREALGALQENEREKIDATQEGSKERLSAINAAIQEENGYGLQETGFYRSMLQARVNLVRQMSEEEEKITAEAGKIAAEHGQKMAQLQLAADEEESKTRLSGMRISEQQRIAVQMQFENQSYSLTMTAMSQEIAALDKHAKDYDNKLQAIQNKRAEATKAYENKITAIKEQAEQERNQRILSAEQQFDNTIASGLASVLMRHESFGQMILSIGDQIATGILTNATKAILADDMTKPHDAAAAARKAFKAGEDTIPGIGGVILGGTLAAGAFAAVMAYGQGTDSVRGVGRGDVVPAMLTPGEGIVPGGVMDKLRGLADSGGLDANRQGQVHLHYMPTYHVNTIDGDGIRGTLRKHSEEFSNHFHSELRKLNR